MTSIVVRPKTQNRSQSRPFPRVQTHRKDDNQPQCSHVRHFPSIMMLFSHPLSNSATVSSSHLPSRSLASPSANIYPSEQPSNSPTAMSRKLYGPIPLSQVITNLATLIFSSRRTQKETSLNSWLHFPLVNPSEYGVLRGPSHTPQIWCVGLE